MKANETLIIVQSLGLEPKGEKIFNEFPFFGENKLKKKEAIIEYIFITLAIT